MDDKTKTKTVGNTITGALISGVMGFLVAVFMSEPSYRNSNVDVAPLSVSHKMRHDSYGFSV